MIRSSGNVKMAIEAIRGARWRSLLTTLGIVVGVVSVVTTVSLGEGAKRQVVGQINQAGPDLITIRPGAAAKRDHNGQLTGPGLLGSLNVGAFSQRDFEAIRQAPGVRMASSLSYVTNTASHGDQTYDDGFVVGTTEDLPALLNQKLAFGAFFSGDESRQNVAVIGKRVAEQLFGENVPLGRAFTIRDQEFAVRGVFEEFPTSPLVPNADYNRMIFIPQDTAIDLTDDTARLYQILARPESPRHVDETAKAIDAALYKVHAKQRDFAVLRQEDNLALAHDTLNLLTVFVSSVAAISLIVGGIGILNIMLVSVTERTHEIGVRKAIGATNRQILSQFLTESAILSLAGGFLGIIMSLLVNYLFRIFTDLTPVLTWQIIGVAVGVSVSVGIVFGITPALKAARKRPIDALRHE